MRLAASSVMALFVFVLCSLANIAFARSDVSYVHQTTTPPLDARFEIVQSQLAAKWTFRLDRYTGYIHQLVKTPDGGNAWEPMLVQGISEISNPGRPRFVIFTSGLAARHTFLIDSDTGQTWTLVTITHPSKPGRRSTGSRRMAAVRALKALSAMELSPVVLFNCCDVPNHCNSSFWGRQLHFR